MDQWSDVGEEKRSPDRSVTGDPGLVHSRVDILFWRHDWRSDDRRGCRQVWPEGRFAGLQLASTRVGRSPR